MTATESIIRLDLYTGTFDLVQQDKNGDVGSQTRYDFSKIKKIKTVSVWKP